MSPLIPRTHPLHSTQVGIIASREGSKASVKGGTSEGNVSGVIAQEGGSVNLVDVTVKGNKEVKPHNTVQCLFPSGT